MYSECPLCVLFCFFRSNGKHKMNKKRKASEIPPGLSAVGCPNAYLNVSSRSVPVERGGRAQSLNPLLLVYLWGRHSDGTKYRALIQMASMFLFFVCWQADWTKLARAAPHYSHTNVLIVPNKLLHSPANMSNGDRPLFTHGQPA